MENRRIHTRKNVGNRIRVSSICLYFAVLCGLCAITAGCKSQAGFYVNQQEKTGAEAGSEEKESEKAEDETAADSPKGRKDSAEKGESSLPKADPVFVQVSGAVQNPGVYEVAAGSRIFEAVALAGGLTEEADLRLLNQALPVEDGQMIYVYARGEAPAEALPNDGEAGNQSAGSKADERINLNTASVEQLMTLPGIGQAKAEYIVSYREKHGAFEKIEDIMEIEGIKEGVFSKIEDRIKVD